MSETVAATDQDFLKNRILSVGRSIGVVATLQEEVAAAGNIPALVALGAVTDSLKRSQIIFADVFIAGGGDLAALAAEHGPHFAPLDPQVLQPSVV